MRVKQIFSPLGAKLLLVWRRLTLSKLITCYVLLALIHCFVQVVFQLNAFALNSRAADFLNHVMIEGKVARNDGSFTILDKSGALRQCLSPFGALNPQNCQRVWAPRSAADSSQNATTVPEESEYPSSSMTAVTPTATATPIASTATPTPAPVRSSSVVSQSTSTLTVTTTASIPVATAVSNTPVPSGGSRVYVGEDDDGDDDDGATFSTLPIVGSPRRRRSVELQASFGSDGKLAEMTLMGLHTNLNDHSMKHVETVDAADQVTVSAACVRVLDFPLNILDNTKREDIVFIAFQFWVLGMSIVALLNQSVPHAIAALCTHVLATAWSVFQIFHTRGFQTKFKALVTDGACKGVNILPKYWQTRAQAELPVLALNCVAFVLFTFLTWRIVKAFGWQTFKRIGADLQINRIYKLVLIYSISLQLSIFFIVVSMALWIDQLYNGAIGRDSQHAMLYKGLYIVMYLILIPWLIMGWTAVRSENRRAMHAFIILSALFIASDVSMFASVTWRLTFLTWTFFAIMSSVAAALTVIVLILGIMCRLNFGRSLSQYLRAEEDTDDFNAVSPIRDSSYSEKPWDNDEEKVALPSPTYNSTFNSNQATDNRSINTNNLGSRFSFSSNHGSMSHETVVGYGNQVNLGRNLTMMTNSSWRSGDDHGRDVNINTPRPPLPTLGAAGLSRNSSVASSVVSSGSGSSFGSVGGGSRSGKGSGTGAASKKEKRWVIE